jgi:hypothetical protein
MPIAPPMHSTFPEWALLVSGRRCSFLARANASIGIGVVFSDCIQFNQPIALAFMNASVYSEKE